MAVDSEARMLAANAYDVADQALKVIVSFPQGFNYKGEVDYISDLPTTGNTVGDVYTVKYRGSSGTDPLNDEYVWGKYEGIEQWILRTNLQQYAKIDGSYVLMNVGTSDNLVDKKAIGSLQDSFFFRPTASSGVSIDDDGTAQIKSIRGRTLVWNQFVKTVDPPATMNNVTFIDNGDGSYRVYTNGAASATTSLKISDLVDVGQGHKMLMFGCPPGGSNNGYSIADSMNGVRDIGVGYVYSVNYTGQIRINIRVGVGTTIDEPGVTFRPQTFDLTAMFGAGNEPSTVAEFRSEYPLSHYDYSAPRMLNFAGTGIKSVGFNQLDPETGTLRIVPNEQYQITGTYTSISSDSGETISPNSSGKFTPTLPGTLTVTGTDSDTCVHFVHSGYRDDETELYWSEIRNIPTATYFPTGMKSAGIVYDELTPDKAITRIKSINLGIASWDFTSTSSSIVISDRASGSDIPYVINRVLPAKITSLEFNSNNKGLVLQYEEGSYQNISELYLDLQGFIMYYPLGTPVETPIDPPLNLSYRVADFGTEEVLPVNDSEPDTSPLVMVAHYNRDYTRQLDNVIDNIGDGAEAGALAQSAQTVPAGQLIMGGFNSDGYAELRNSQIEADLAKTVIYAVGNTPTNDGVYVLKATVSGGITTLSWEAAE